jgi:hypothetical protein
LARDEDALTSFVERGTKPFVALSRLVNKGAGLAAVWVCLDKVSKKDRKTKRHIF